ncbi:MAG: hypothetical protein EBZ49_08225 [Proteobacteria bacterium]|nr:hypothetical protein [Pseudomonadota bacterium]
MSLNYESGYGSGYEGDAGGFVSDSGFDTATGTRTPLKPSSVAPPMAQTAAIAAAKLAQQQLLLSQQKAAVTSPAVFTKAAVENEGKTSPPGKVAGRSAKEWELNPINKIKTKLLKRYFMFN